MRRARTGRARAAVADNGRVTERSQSRRPLRAVVAGLIATVFVLASAAVAGYALALIVTARLAAPAPLEAGESASQPPSPAAPSATSSADGGATEPAAGHGQPAASGRVHVVMRGETLGLIARRYGLTVSAIVEANSLANPNLVVPGQRLVIPGR